MLRGPPSVAINAFKGIVKTIIVVFSPPCSFGSEDTSVVLGSPREVLERTVAFQKDGFPLTATIFMISIFMFAAFPF